MRAIVVFSVFALAGAGLSAFGEQHAKSSQEQPQVVQTDIYYFGGTYRTVAAETAEQCASFCASDVRCEAWSQIGARIETAPYCELKRSGGLPEAQPQTISGRSPRHEALYANPPLKGLPPGASSYLLDTELEGGPE